VADSILETGCPYPGNDLVGSEGAFPGRAPDVDAISIQHKDVRIHPSQGGAQGIEAEAVVCRHKDQRFWRWIAQSI
jgi:hypothetical protein